VGGGVKRSYIWFWLVWSVIMAVQAVRSVMWAIHESRFGWKIMWLIVCLVYALFSYGSVQIVRGALRQRRKTSGSSN
jgi:hypothetical protein